MKKIFALLTIVAGLAVTSAYAQTQKIAHLNVDQLLSLMPETKAMEDALNKYGEQLQKDMEDMRSELESRAQNLQTNQANWTQLRIAKEQEELQLLYERIQQYQAQAQQDFQDKQLEMMQPIIEKAQNAVNEVARENGFTYVLDSSQSKGVVIFAELGEDILPLVKAKLGITATTPATTTPTVDTPQE